MTPNGMTKEEILGQKKGSIDRRSREWKRKERKRESSLELLVNPTNQWSNHTFELYRKWEAAEKLREKESKFVVVVCNLVS